MPDRLSLSGPEEGDVPRKTAVEWRVVQRSNRHRDVTPIPMPNEPTARDRQRWLDENHMDSTVLRIERREVTEWEVVDA